MPRPSVDELLAVPPGENVYRFVKLQVHYDRSLPVRDRVLIAHLARDQVEPRPDSYGMSVYVESMLANGFATVVHHVSRYREYAVVRLPVVRLTELKVRVLWSPEDADVPELRNAHASLVGVCKGKWPAGNRQEVHALFNECVVYEPS